MKTISTTLYRITRDGDTIFVSLTRPSQEDLDNYRDDGQTKEVQATVEQVELPVVDSRVETWEGDAPHLHFECPKCGNTCNVDLEPDDENPRFSCCDGCGWDSIMWLQWDGAAVERISGVVTALREIMTAGVSLEEASKSLHRKEDVPLSGMAAAIGILLDTDSKDAMRKAEQWCW